MKFLKAFSQLFDSFHEGIYIVDRNRKILYFNPVSEKISGFKEKEIIHSFCSDNILNHVDDAGNKLCLGGCPLSKSIRNNVIMDAHVYLHHKEGHRVPIHVRTIPIVQDGEVVGAIEVFTSEVKRDLNRNMELIHKNVQMVDPLTSLLNRYFLDKRLKSILDSEQNMKRALLFIDLDDFKEVNDTYGHLIGDEILKAVSNTILLNTKEDEYAIRFGGDEILLLIKIEDLGEIKEKAERLKMLVINSRIRKDDFEYTPTISIGAVIRKENEDFLETIHRADRAMYKAKNLGKNQIHLDLQ